MVNDKLRLAPNRSGQSLKFNHFVFSAYCYTVIMDQIFFKIFKIKIESFPAPEFIEI